MSYIGYSLPGGLFFAAHKRWSLDLISGTGADVIMNVVQLHVPDVPSGKAQKHKIRVL
jgi:hypothetical protein